MPNVFKMPSGRTRTIPEIIDAIDWEELRRQKSHLIRAQRKVRTQREFNQYEGVLALIDHVQDAAAAAGYPAYRKPRT